jgi:phage gp29-like protein
VAKQPTKALKAPQTAPADTRAATEATVRTFCEWTPARLRNAERAAESGNLRDAANICEWLLSDDRIRGVLSARIQGLLGLVPSFEKAGDRRRSGRAIKALEADDDWWVSYPESEAWLMIAWGLLLGVGPGRHQWLSPEGHGGRVLPCPRFWHPQNLRFDWQTRQWYMRLQYGTDTAGTVEEQVVAGDGTWILHTPYGANRPWAMGLWRGLAWWKLLKEMARGDWANHSEKASTLVAESDPKISPTSKPQRDDLASSIYDRGREAVVVLPPGFSLKLVESVANTKNLYEAQIAMADMAFAITIRGGNLTTNTEGGSKAAAEVQERTGDFVNLRFDAETWSTTLNSQSLPWWAEFNFGSAELAPWPDYPIAPQRNLLEYGQTVMQAINTLDRAEQIGLDVDRQAFIEEFELQEFLKPGKRPPIMAPVKPPAPMGESAAPAEPATADPSPAPSNTP